MGRAGQEGRAEPDRGIKRAGQERGQRAGPGKGAGGRRGPEGGGHNLEDFTTLEDEDPGSLAVLRELLPLLHACGQRNHSLALLTRDAQLI